MNKEQLKKSYRIGTFNIGKIFSSASKYIIRDRERIIFLLLPYMIYSLASNLINNVTVNADPSSIFIVYLFMHFLGLFATAYYSLSFTRDGGHSFDLPRAQKALGRLWPMYKTELSLFALIIPIAFGLSILMGIPLAVYGVEPSETQIIIMVGIIIFPLLIFMIRYLLAVYLTVLYPVDGFLALHLSAMIFKKNRLAIFFLCLLYFILIGGLITVAFLTSEYKIWEVISALLSAVISIFLILIFTQICEEVLETIKDDQVFTEGTVIDK
jgi:hypothetical protein